jgi:putative addiction module killer protein
MRVLQTDAFALRLRTLRDHRAQARIARAVERMAGGNLGDAKSLGSGLLEARIHYGPGYRVYFILRGAEVVVLLLCGSKSTQVGDIERARVLAQTVRKGAVPWPSS